MRATISLLLFALVTASALAQNAVSNGSFESGDLTGWTAAGAASVSGTYPAAPGAQGGYVAVFDRSAGPTGSLSQSFSVSAGQPYQLSFEYGTATPGLNETMTVVLTDSNGNIPVTTDFGWTLVGSNYYRTCTAIFVPDTPVMTVQFKDVTPANVTQKGLLGNVQVAQIPTFSRAGRYVGTDVETVSFGGTGFVDTKIFDIKMTIDSAGRMLALLAPASALTVGTINDGGQVTIGAGDDFTGTATFHGGDIDFRVTEEELNGGNFNYATVVRTRKYTLHKVSTP